MAKKDKYVKRPELTDDSNRRVYWVMAAMTGAATMKQAAKELGLSRTQFHNLFNQTLHALRETVTPKTAGRPARSPREKELLEENERLRRQNERLQQRVDTVDRLLGVASEMMRGRIQPTTRSKRTRTKASPDEAPKSEEPDEAIRLLEGVLEMRQLGLSAPLAAAVAGVSTQTVARWKRNRARGAPLRHRGVSGPPPRWSPEAEREAVELMRELRGLVGADTLSKTCPGLSRRSAARVKHDTLTAMERDRKEQVARVTITRPGIVRGFDAMHLQTPQGQRYALVAADAAVPYRTTIALVGAYDSASVAGAIEQDIAVHGPPLVYRLDRASCHRTDEVDGVLRRYGVLRLHGPPRHPGFYGQTERQMREHRAWLAGVDDVDDAELERMRRALNGAWRRPTLGFRTAEEVWNDRSTPCEDRSRLRDEVTERAASIAAELDPGSIRGSVADFAWRLAIQKALTIRGYLRCKLGGWC
jgi:transposase